MPFCPAVFDSEFLTLDITGFRQPSAKRGYKMRKSIGRGGVHKADHRHCRLLRVHRERPTCCAAEQRDEVASLQLSKSHPLPPSQGQTVTDW